ncbi:WD40-repeat-containing domain protein [Ephemerocybe angulata]|uniref:WD40-repeat-containing domain protein n=1 Tax=Ephemerocybe angulata TaxID=980116 RepID=A0A8H6MAF9_9AGAR|nr:WD40-repeat-containing domain protein [Tulosesus angulatus]
MVRHAKKKQKTSKTTAVNVHDTSARLDLLLDDSTKDDEERRLESALFGVKYAPGGSGKGKEKPIELDDEDEEEITAQADGGRALAHLEDTDLFFVDDGVDDDVPMYGEDDEEASDNDDNDEEGSEGSSSEAEPTPANEPSASSTFLSKIKSSKKPAAWTDADDVTVAAGVSLLKGPSRLRKLRQAVDEDVIDTREYETRLRRQFENVNPEPEWAKKAKNIVTAKKHDLDLLSENTDDEAEDEDDLPSSNRVFADTRRKGRKGEVKLPKDTLSIERLRDANQATQNSGSGEVRVASFHPNPAASILCVATADRRIRLFNVDGHLSPLLTTLHFPTLPMTSSTAALFHPSGQSLLISGPRPFFYTYDLQSGTPTHHARGLWGTTFNNLTDGTAILQRRRKRGGDGETVGRGDAEAMNLTSFSPYGDMLAVAGRGGYVHLVDWKSGAGQVIGSLKCSGAAGSAAAGGINGMWWVPPTLSDGALGAGSQSSSSKLAVLSGDSEVYIWDVGERKCLQRWQDEGGFRGAAKVLAGTSSGGGYMAVGSNTGYVNLYGSDSFATAWESTTSKPKPLKSIANLTTPISTAKFNHDAQVLAIASKDKKDSLRMVHLPSQSVFSNWPTAGTPLGHVTAVDFSPSSEYVAIGNTRGRVLLYHLKDYGVW